MSFNPTDIVGAGGIDDSRFKPWWEKVIEYNMRGMLVTSLLILYIESVAKPIQCAPKYSSANLTLTSEQAALANEFCHRQRGVFLDIAGIVSLGMTIALYICFSTWLLSSTVTTVLTDIKRIDDSLRNKNIRAIDVDNALATPAVKSENQVPQQQDGVVGNQIPQQQDGVVGNQVQQQQGGVVGNQVQQQQGGVVENQIPQQQGGVVGNQVQQQQGGVVENQIPQQQDGVVGNQVQQQQDGVVGNQVQQQQGGVVENQIPQQQGGVVGNQVQQQQGGSVGNRNQVGDNVLSEQIEKKAQEARNAKNFGLAGKLDLIAKVYKSVVMDKLQRPYNPIVGTMCCGPWEKVLKRINPGSKIAACYFVRCCLAFIVSSGLVGCVLHFIMYYRPYQPNSSHCLLSDDQVVTVGTSLFLCWSDLEVKIFPFVAIYGILSFVAVCMSLVGIWCVVIVPRASTVLFIIQFNKSSYRLCDAILKILQAEEDRRLAAGANKRRIRIVIYDI